MALKINSFIRGEKKTTLQTVGVWAGRKVKLLENWVFYFKPGQERGLGEGL